MAFRYGLTELDIKGNGEKIKLMERANFGTLMATCLTASGRMIKLMGMEYILIKMEPNTKAIGKMICKMDGV